MGARSSDSKLFLTSMRDGKVEFFCPLCHTQQSSGVSAALGWRSHMQILAITLALTVALWSVLKAVTLLAYMVVWAVVEFQHRTRKRAALVCSNCGFDPFLYKQDVEKARVAVRKYWEEKITKDGAFRGVKLKNYTTLPAATTEAKSKNTPT